MQSLLYFLVMAVVMPWVAVWSKAAPHGCGWTRCCSGPRGAPCPTQTMRCSPGPGTGAQHRQNALTSQQKVTPLATEGFAWQRRSLAIPARTGKVSTESHLKALGPQLVRSV